MRSEGARHDGESSLSSGGMPYGVRLQHVADTHPDAVALIVAAAEGTEITVRWSELDDRANQVARLLAARGVDQDDVVVVALPNSLEHVLATLGAWKLGASVLPLRAALPPWERERLLAIANARLVVADWPDLVGTVTRDDIAGSTSLDRSPLDHVGTPGTTRLIATSGSTGTPKIIVGRAPGVYVEGDDPTATVTDGAHDLVYLVTSPLYHNNGFSFCAPMLLADNLVVLMERFDAARTVELIERHRVNQTVLVPIMLQRIAQLDGVRDHDLSSLERVIYGGATLPQWVARTWLELVPPERFMFVYGGSEILGTAMCDGHEWLAHPGTAGRPVGCEVLILDPDHRPLPTGEVGEIFMKLPTDEAPFAYVGTDTPEPILGGFRSYGDLGYLDRDGFLYVVDRRQDMIVTGGANVFPAEVEAALSEHPHLADAVVVGLPDDAWGRRVHAIVQPRDPDDPPTDDDLRAHCKDRLAAYKVPKTFEVVREMSRTAAGKVNRTRLAEERSSSSSSSSSSSGGDDDDDDLEPARGRSRPD